MSRSSSIPFPARVAVSEPVSEPRQRRGWRFVDVSRLAMRLLAPLTIFPLELWAQAALGQEIQLFPLQMIAVAQMTFEFGRRGAALGVALAIGMWLAGTYAGGWIYDSEWIRYLNAGTRGLMCAFAAVLVLVLRGTIAVHRAQMERLRALLDVCRGCGAVRGGGEQWVAMDRLAEYVATRPRVSECPLCAGRAKR